jgi:hypothetical protein
VVDAALQQAGWGEEYSLIQVACRENNKYDAKLGILSVICEQWVIGNDSVEHTVA